MPSPPTSPARAVASRTKKGCSPPCLGAAPAFMPTSVGRAPERTRWAFARLRFGAAIVVLSTFAPARAEAAEPEPPLFRPAPAADGRAGDRAARPEPGCPRVACGCPRHAPLAGDARPLLLLRHPPKARAVARLRRGAHGAARRRRRDLHFARVPRARRRAPRPLGPPRRRPCPSAPSPSRRAPLPFARHELPRSRRRRQPRFRSRAYVLLGFFGIQTTVSPTLLGGSVLTTLQVRPMGAVAPIERFVVRFEAVSLFGRAVVAKVGERAPKPEGTGRRRRRRPWTAPFENPRRDPFRRRGSRASVAPPKPTRRSSLAARASSRRSSGSRARSCSATRATSS